MKSARRIRFEQRQPAILAGRAERHAQAEARRKQQAEWQATLATTKFATSKRNGRKAQKKHAVNGHCPCGGCTLVQTCHE